MATKKPATGWHTPSAQDSWTPSDIGFKKRSAKLNWKWGWLGATAIALFCIPVFFYPSTCKDNLVWACQAPPIKQIQDVAFSGDQSDALRFASFPIATKDFHQYTSPFGNRPAPCAGCSSFHKGLDIVGEMGAPVYVWWNGDAEVVPESAGDGCGNYIHVTSGDWEHYYCHLSEILIAPGKVKTGQLIGKVGATGGVTGPHLHWMLLYKGEHLDPGIVIKAMKKARRSQPTPQAVAPVIQKPVVGVNFGDTILNPRLRIFLAALWSRSKTVPQLEHSWLIC